MGEASTFRETLVFFDRLGIYDVILPFLLVFTIVFAILEKTRVLGTESIDGATVTKKNLNALTAFVIAFMAIASSNIVGIINKTASQVVILLLLSVFFLILVGSFAKQSEDGVFLDGGMRKTFITIMFIGIVFIFLNALPGRDGKTWLQEVTRFILNFENSNVVSSVILVIVVVLFMLYIIKDPKKKTSSE